MKRLRYIGKTLKQDVTDQKTCSKLVTKQGETEWNDETYMFFFYKPIFCFVTNETIKIYRENSEKDETDQKIWNMLVTKQSETEWNHETYIFFFL